VIGRRGVVMGALQHLVNKVVYRDRTGDRTKPLVIDAGVTESVTIAESATAPVTESSGDLPPGGRANCS
jgi:hypothetical protein